MTLPEPQILRYTRWLARERGLNFEPTTYEGYDALWRWSVDDLPAFWKSIWDYFEVGPPMPIENVLAEERMPGARWFEGASVNYVRHVFRHADAAHAAGHPAIGFQNEALRALGQTVQTSWPELRRQVAALAAALRSMGVGPGDRVVAFLPNIPQTLVAFLATASLGAIWSVCSPDMGPVAVLDRFRQIEPKVLIACDGYVHAGVAYDRLALVRELLAGLPSVAVAVLVRNLDVGAEAMLLSGRNRAAYDYEELVASPADAGGAADFEPVLVAFDHPLWVVYSSGTTGLPKAIVHGHGGVMLEQLKGGALHNNVGPSAQTGDRYAWYSSTGWIMWNSQPGALLGGTTVCLFDGNPAGATRGNPDWSTLWRFAADVGATFFGAGAAFYASCMKAEVEPQKVADLSRLRAIGSTGSPLSADAYRWIGERLPQAGGKPIWIATISGGTDFAGAFVAGMATLPVVEGEMQCRCLGAAVEAWSEPDAALGGRGRPLVDTVGELVCIKPMPSMPLGFWGDAGNKRLLESYFDIYPNVWRHGDWIRITERGGAVIYGRSDATINRHGIRMGTAELYRAIEAIPEVLDSLVVDLEYLGRESYMPLFVVLREGVALDDALVKRMKDAIKTALSARHVPNEIFQVAAIPRTLSGKKMELPVKKLLMGTPAEQVFRFDAMADAANAQETVAWFERFAQEREAKGSGSGGRTA